MADVLTGSPFVPPADRSRDRTAATQRALLILVVLLFLAFVSELAYHLVIAPNLAITTVNLENGTGLTDEELLSVSGVRVGAAFFRVDTAQVAARLKAIPAVRDATVDATFPNRIDIRVAGRSPLACALVQTASGQRLVVFDDEGVVFRVDETAASGDLPVVSGLRFPAAEVGLRLPPLLSGFLASLRVLRDDSPQLFGLFSEYRVVRRNESAFDVVLYPMNYDVPVRIGSRINPGMIEYVIMMLDMLDRQGRLVDAEELDVRSGEGVLRMKGGDRG